MSKFILLQSKKGASAIPALFVLPSQQIDLPKGGTLTSDQTWNVAGCSDKRMGYIVGTTFITDTTHLIAEPGRRTYTVTLLKPVFNPDGSRTEPNASMDRLTAEEEQFVKELLENGFKPGTSPAEAEPATGDVFAAVKTGKKTRLEEIREKYHVPSVADCGFHVDSGVWELLVNTAAYKHNPLLITGPTGTGKTELILLLGKRLGLDVSVYDMGSIHDPIIQLLGQQTLVGGEKGSVTKFTPARFVQDIQKPGIILLDEVNRAPASTNNYLIPLLDDRRTLFMDNADGAVEKMVKVHPECVFICTANIGAGYNGTEKLDDAVRDRLRITIEMDYLSPDRETELLMKRCDISKTDASVICTVCDLVRKKAAEHTLSRPLSTRESLTAASLVADGWPLKEAMKLTFLNLFDGDGGMTSERQTVLNCINAR